MELPNCISINQFHVLFFQLLIRGYRYFLRSVLCQSCLQLKYHFYGYIWGPYFWTRMKRMLFHVAVIYRGVLKKNIEYR